MTFLLLIQWYSTTVSTTSFHFFLFQLSSSSHHIVSVSVVFLVSGLVCWYLSLCPLLPQPASLSACLHPVLVDVMGRNWQGVTNWSPPPPLPVFPVQTIWTHLGSKFWKSCRGFTWLDCGLVVCSASFFLVWVVFMYINIQFYFGYGHPVSIKGNNMTDNMVDIMQFGWYDIDHSIVMVLTPAVL